MATRETLSVDKWKIQELKEWLADHGQKVSGVKKDLVARIKVCVEDTTETKGEKELREKREQELRLQEKLSTPRAALPNPKNLQNWSRNLDSLPEITFKDLTNYLVFSPCEYFTEDNMGCFRQLKAYTFFKDGNVQNIEIENISNDCSYCFVRATVIPSMKPDIYKTWVVIAKPTGYVHSADCNCTAGLGEACNHIAALLFALEDYNRTQKNNVPCTSLPCEWNKPRKRKLSPRKIEAMNPVKYVYGKDKKPAAIPNKTYMPSAQVDASFRDSFLGSLSAVNPGAAILTIYKHKTVHQSENEISGDLNVCQFEEIETKVDVQDINNNIPKDYIPTALHSGLCAGKTPNDVESYFSAMHLNQDEADRIEECSRGQNNNPKWKTVRKGRLTASLMGTICKRRKTTSPEKLVSQIIQGQTDKSLDNVPAIKWGREHEQIARQSYVQVMKSSGHKNITVFERGLVVNVNYPYLGASPDGYVYCPSCQPYHGLLEIKCPYKWRESTLQEALDDKDFYSEKRDGSIKLKENSNYFYQVQAQMAICRRAWCDFVIWTEKEMYIERIPYKEGFWNGFMLPKLKSFYKEAVIPRVLSNNQ